MKTLVNKRNPQIRISAPEITIDAAPNNNYLYVYWIPAINEIYSPIDWTLVEEIKGNLEEIPSNVDLEKAAEEYADKHGFRVSYDGSNNFYDDVDVKASLEGFKAGAKWMEEQMKGDSK